MPAAARQGVIARIEASTHVGRVRVCPCRRCRSSRGTPAARRWCSTHGDLATEWKPRLISARPSESRPSLRPPASCQQVRARGDPGGALCLQRGRRRGAAAPSPGLRRAPRYCASGRRREPTRRRARRHLHARTASGADGHHSWARELLRRPSAAQTAILAVHSTGRRRRQRRSRRAQLRDDLRTQPRVVARRRAREVARDVVLERKGVERRRLEERRRVRVQVALDGASRPQGIRCLELARVVEADVRPSSPFRPARRAASSPSASRSAVVR